LRKIILHFVQGFTKDKEGEIMEWWKKGCGAHAELGVKCLVFFEIDV